MFVAGPRKHCELVYFTSFRLSHSYVSVYVVIVTMETMWIMRVILHIHVSTEYIYVDIIL